jgi:hypothetical protein
VVLATGADILRRYGCKPLAYHASAIERVHEERANRPFPATRTHPAQTRGGGFATVIMEKHQEATDAAA